MEENKNKEEYPIGCLVEFKDLTYIQRDLLIKLLSREYSYIFQILYNVLEDDALVLKLIDIFADKKIRFPSRKKVYRMLEKIKIYTYAKSHNYSNDSINVLAKQYNKRPSQVRMLIDNINNNLNKKMHENIE